MSHDVIVIGAGVSGLAAAYDLSQSGHDVIVLERQVVVGGNAISERMGGFLMEYGPSTMNGLIPRTNEISYELGLTSSRVELGDGVRKRYIRDAGDLHGIPIHAFGFLTSPYLSMAARISIMGELVRRRNEVDNEETVHEFVSRRFGREFADKVMEPLVAGLFAGDSRRLSVAAVFPKLVEFEQHYGSVTRAVINARHGKQPGKRLFSWREGISTLPRALAASLGSRIKTAITVKRLVRLQDGFEVGTSAGSVRAKSVVLAVQPHVAAMLLEDLDSEAAVAAGDIAAPPISVVFLGMQRSQVAHPLDSLGFLSVRDKANVVTGAQFCSTMFPDRAPPGHVSIASYVGGARNPELALVPEPELLALVREDLNELLGLKGEPVVQRSHHWSRGLPQYTVGHPERVRVIESSNERVNGLFMIGNYLHGVSVANCLATAEAAGAKIKAQLAAGTRRNFDDEIEATRTYSSTGARAGRGQC